MLSKSYPCGHSAEADFELPAECPLCSKYGYTEVPTTEDVIKAYDQTKSIWKAGAVLGMSGQSVHERLVAAGHKMKRSHLTDEEKSLIRERYETAFKRGDLKTAELAAELGMSRVALERYARSIGLTRKTRPLNQDRNDCLQRGKKRRFETVGHPRGMLGKKHTQEARQRMGEVGFTKQLFQPEWLKERKVARMMATRVRNGTYANQRPKTTWKAGWRVIGGKRKYFRSRWESNYARYLEWMKVHCAIKEWEHEPEVFWFEGIKRGCVSYLPDFRVTELDGSFTYHEVKGWMDARSKTKIKRMAKYHPQVKLVVVTSKEYKELTKSMLILEPEWEVGNV